jgi:uncharacterized protein
LNVIIFDPLPVDILAQSLLFGLAVGFIVLGLIGVIVPILPGILLIWLAVLVYAVLTGFQAITPFTFFILSLIALVTGTSDIWMSLLGAKKGGASRRSVLYGVLGSFIGFIAGSIFIIGGLFGAVAGYILGILLGEYQKHRDWNLALKAGVGGLAGWGLATMLQLGGGLLMLLIFVWRVLVFDFGTLP